MDFAQEIIAWYHQHQRDLPWRQTRDPYVIWLSEVILQQTRVEQGLPYFYRFAEHYPTVADFAAADEDAILNDWQGLGYYSRARNMHHTAQLVMERHQGQFPKSYDELIQLKGIGEYTAAAISSFSNNEDRAVVDGNVFRLLSRYFGIAEPINTSRGKKVFTELANEILPKGQAGVYNQAIMEFGSLQCRPKNPLCENCPLQAGCVSFGQQSQASLPVKLKKLKIRERFFNYIVLRRGDAFLLRKRGAGDIWQNLHEFPMLETEKLLQPNELLDQEWFIRHFGPEVKIKQIKGPVKHVLTHQRLLAQFIEIETSQAFNPDQEWFFAGHENLKKLAQPKLIFEFLIKFLN